ncbi:MAG TPA: hypothetical protein VL053_09415 [Arachidicoccus sp.]|nr:hypothetical protein [Arachidicoccus sp.]
MKQIEQSAIDVLGHSIRESIYYFERTYEMWVNRGELSEEDLNWAKEDLEMNLAELYYRILAYLELKGLPQLTETFKNKFYPIIQEKQNLFKEVSMFPSEDLKLLIIREFEAFLSPFQILDYNKSEVKKLTEILKDSDYILKNCNTQITNEASIYKEVKWVLSLYYPDIRRRNRASFIQQFKTYHPDILIPSLYTAIEYKLIKDRSDNIDVFIDQIRIDAQNYQGDIHYQHFISVIYIMDASVATPRSIEICWESKKFPHNWDLVIVNGSPSRPLTSTTELR